MGELFGIVIVVAVLIGVYSAYGPKAMLMTSRFRHSGPWFSYRCGASMGTLAIFRGDRWPCR